MKLEDFATSLQANLLAISDELGSVSSLATVAEVLAGVIKQRIQDGRGASGPNGLEYVFQGLAESTVAERRRLDNRGGLSPATTPGTSNLTRTGEMLDSIAVETFENGFRIYFGTPEMAERASYAQVDPGVRPFFYLSSREMDLLKEYLNTKLQEGVDLWSKR